MTHHVELSSAAQKALGLWQFLGGIDLGPKALWVTGGVLLLNLVLVATFYKELKLATFDPTLAAKAAESLIPLLTGGKKKFSYERGDAAMALEVRALPASTPVISIANSRPMPTAGATIRR